MKNRKKVLAALLAGVMTLGEDKHYYRIDSPAEEQTHDPSSDLRPQKRQKSIAYRKRYAVHDLLLAEELYHHKRQERQQISRAVYNELVGARAGRYAESNSAHDRVDRREPAPSHHNDTHDRYGRRQRVKLVGEPHVRRL